MLIGYTRVSKADGSQTTDLQRDALLAAGGVTAAVTHPIASFQRLYADYLAAQSHHWLQAGVGDVPPLSRRRRAIQNNARAHPVKMRLWPQQNATRCGNGTLTRFAFAKGIKDSELLLGCATFWFIRARKMADDIDRLAHIFTLR